MDETTGLKDYPLARRGMLMSGLMSGLTVAVPHGAAAQVIQTDTSALEAGETKVPTDEGEIPAYYARPQGTGRFPTVLVIEEIFGVHEHIKDLCRRLAKLGYMAVAPELYARIADLSKYTDAQAIVRDVISKAPDDRKMKDLDATAAWAQDNKGDRTRLGVTGFCRGGRDTWLYAAHNPGLKAAAAWYGPVGGTPSPIQPRTADDVATEIKCPLLGLYGKEDAGIPVAAVQATFAKARAAGRDVELEIYDAPHGFNADYRPSYRKDAAEAAWARMNAFLRHHGVV